MHGNTMDFCDKGTQDCTPADASSVEDLVLGLVVLGSAVRVDGILQ